MRDPDFTLSAGPVAATPRVLAALGSPIVYHYDPAFIERFRATERKLKDVFLTKNDVLLMQGEAVLGLEAAARGLVQPGTKVLNLVQGVFGKGMGYWLEDFGAELHEVEVAYNDAVDPADVERYLDEHPGIELVTVVHSETPSGTWCDIAAIGPIAHQRGALMLVDCVSSIGGMPLEADAWHLDVCVGGAQKCLGGPPGMSLMTVSDAAWERIRANPAAPRASYLSMLDWKEQWIDGEKFPFTPSVSDIYGVEAAADELLEEGLENSIARHERSAAACRAGVRAMGLELWPRSDEVAVGLRDRDHRPRRPHRRAGARPLPRALRRDGLRGPGGREPRPHRPHGPVGTVAAPGRRARGARAHLRRPRCAGRDRRRARGRPGRAHPGARGTGQACGPSRSVMIFDSHMHVGSFESMFGVSLDRDGIEELMREHGITGGVVFYPDHEYVREVVESIPGLYALYWGNPRVPGYVEELREYLDHPKFIGLKLHPLIDGFHPNDPSVHPMIEAVQERGYPTLIHCGHPIFTLPWSIEELAVSFPDAKVVIGHMGHGNVVYINASIDIAARRPNVYLETSGMPMHTKIREAYERVGETRVLFGTDVPFHHPVVEIAKVRVSGLDDVGMERVLNRNGRLLFLGAEDAEAPV